MRDELVTLITSTGFRKEAFFLCQEYMYTQTYTGPIQWIIIDDERNENSLSLNHSPSAISVDYFFGDKEWRPGINTQRINLDKALSKVKGEYILWIEDDDYYASTYIETMVKLLKIFPAVGEGNAKYYNLHYRCYKEMQNYIHASLCQTGIRSSHVEIAERAINSGEIYIDIQLWKYVKEESVPHILFNDLNLSIGMKGLPGRKGIGVGHTPIGYKTDLKFEQLQKWIGKEGLEKYKKIFNNERKV